MIRRTAAAVITADGAEILSVRRFFFNHYLLSFVILVLPTITAV